ncbi:20S proteasome subunit beta 3 [Babesia microti strain RI]|uniref:20S proteasome subunit beta 3 n=1 Tax=Babesia microti (strain RI) TaxID=1133968 RepID=I7JCV5_BABMR|nr:20S proteasome subunit beta 3 [Babesia microti strain RI]CCF75465.1 20S proteasome subunit beta 3 [Babesia microti strain RI]|eukprot:XP_012649873.1 20S proteasome subunit beta 3 [Babesia microti strain RI]
MCGHECVSIGSDLRLGVNRFTTIGNDFPKVFKINNKCFFGSSGLATDIQSILKELKFKIKIFELEQERDIGIQSLGHVVANMLYSRRFGPWFISPIVAGLDDKNRPFISSYDLIGAPSDSDDFVVSGSCSDQLFGICESLHHSGMNEDELFETTSQCLLAGLDRDCLSGWGAVVHVITPKKIITKTIQTRMD